MGCRKNYRIMNMTITDFFKGNETHRNEYIVLWQNGEFYEAYGKDAERLSYCTGVTLTRPKDGGRVRAGFHSQFVRAGFHSQLLMKGPDWAGRYLSKMLHSYFVVLLDETGGVTNYYTARLDEGYELESDGSVSYHTEDLHNGLGHIVVSNIPWSQYYNGLRVKKQSHGNHVWAFVMCGRNNNGVHYLYALKALSMTGPEVQSFRDGLQAAEGQHRKQYMVLTYILMNNDEYRPASGEPLPDGFSDSSYCLPRDFVIDPDDDKQLIATNELGTFVYERLD